MSRVRIGCLLVCLHWAATLPAHAATLLNPPVIKDMIFNGQGHCIYTLNVTINGNYLYANGQPGMQTIDVSDPSNLVQISEFTGTSDQSYGSSIKNGYLYLADWYYPMGLLVFNLSKPGQPALTRTINTGNWAWEAEIFGNLLYVSINNETNAGVITYDISTPGNPVVLNSFNLGDNQIGNVARSGNYIYFGHKHELRVYNDINPSSPQFVRTINIPAFMGHVQVVGNTLYTLSQTISGGDMGGMRTFSLTDPSNPQPLGFWPQDGPRDMYFTGNYCVVACSGSQLYTLDVSNPANIIALSNWAVSWPNTGHGGYPVTVTGLGRFIYVGVATGSPPGCDDWYCSNYGARVYSAQLFSEPPIIAEVTPDPGTATVGQAYSRQLTLIEGAAPITWSVVQGPPGTQVSSSGLVSGWQPTLGNAGQTFNFQIQAANSDGSDIESWNVYVQCQPPIIGEVTPDPDGVAAGHPYSRQLTQIQGCSSLTTWSVVQAPSGTQVSSGGLVSGWKPTLGNVGEIFNFQIQASNPDGSDIESWNVRVQYPNTDFDGDGDTDQADFAHLQACLSGDAIPYAAGCADADLDSDGDVDGADFAAFLPCLNGADRSPACL